jgi:hypothetical protein
LTQNSNNGKPKLSENGKMGEGEPFNVTKSEKPILN